MKIIITGASGTIGRALVPYLLARQHDLLLVGRDLSLLEKLYPGQTICCYKKVSIAGVGFDACVHLAIMNNDRADRDIGSFRAANVDLLKFVFRDIKIAGCNHFINLTSFHATNPKSSGPYALSKREADKWLAEQGGIKITSLRIPAVYSKSATGNLAKVNRLPSLLQPATLTLLGALKPIVNVERLVEAINAVIQSNLSGEIIVTNPADKNRLFRIYKKVTDWGLALSILFFAWWLLIIVFFVIKLTSKGPAIFAQTRIGQNEKSFTCYKFRTMRLGTKQAGTHDVTHDAITKVGKFLRKSKIDELPQLFNILRGDLSFVGPRPCLPLQVELIQERNRHEVMNVLPGITGWAQINDIDMSDPVKLAKADSQYVAMRTIPLELLIILRTFIGAGHGDRVNYVEVKQNDRG